MSRMLLISTLTLVAINFLAFGFWIFTCRPRLVVSGVVRGMSHRGKSGPSAVARVADWIRSTRAGLRALDLKAFLPAPRTAVGTPTGDQPTADNAHRTTDLEDWIDEIEQVEDRDHVRLEGSEAWWRAWAESGGSLPSAADSCRLDTLRDDAPAVSSR